MKALVLLLLLLAGCNLAQRYPGAIECRGKATLAGNGGIMTLGSGSGMVTFDCGEGAYIRQGADISGAPEPVMPLPQPPQPVPAPSPPPPVVQPHHPPVPPPLRQQSWAPETDMRSPPRGLVPYIRTIPTTACQPGWTATAWIDTPGVPRCR